MRKYLLSIFSILFVVITCTAQSGSNGTNQVPQVGKINWSVDPFEHAVFVENNGQFDDVIPGEKIFFEAKLGPVIAYFTARGIVYKHVEYEKLDFSKGQDPDADGKAPKQTFYYLTANWQGANSGTTIDANMNDKVSYYYTYPKGTKDTYFANVYKKIMYHNLYPGIDIVYSFPEGSNNLEYTIIVHPGGDLSLVKLKYSKSKGMYVDANGNVVISNEIGTLTETAPLAYYMENHQSVTVSSLANTPTESFTANNLDATKTLVIDPTIQWTTNPNFANNSGYDYAYDLDYDNAGNIYVYGGGNPLQLVKLNAGGAIQWAFTATTMTSSTNFYGDFAVDKHSEECYTVEGWNIAGNARQLKISPAGALLGTNPGNTTFGEMWRIQSSICPQGFVIFGGGVDPYTNQACMLDTTMTSTTPVNMINATTGYHDMALTAVDPFGGFAWTATTQSLSYVAVLNNYLIKAPMPALSPATYSIPDHFAFHEIGSVFYNPNLVFNGINGLVAGRAWLYGYNGDTLKQISKTTGAINAVKMVSNTPYTWGGIDVDLCDNIYLANNTAIQVYDGALNLTSTLPTLPGVNYDLALGTYTSQLLYACGQNFVCSISLGPQLTIPIIITKLPTSCAACSGQATASAMPCGTLDTINVTYLWSDGETTRTANHLCSGVDTVAVTLECGLTYKDTVTIVASGGGYTVTRDSTNATCTIPGTAAVTVTGGNPPYTYHWSNGATTSSTGPVGAGSYCVGIRDNTGCFDSLCITVTGASLPTITATASPDTVCSGNNSTLTSNVNGGTPPYAYSWSSGSTLSSVTVAPTVTTIYTVTVTDVNGCSNSATVQVAVQAAPIITITSSGGDSICTGQQLTLTAAGGLTYVWAPSLACSTCNPVTVSPATTTTYTVIGTDAKGCTGSATFTVKLSEQPNLVITPDMQVCSGKTVTLTVNSTSGGSITYQWMPGGSTSQSLTVTPTSTETYTVTASDACGFKDTTVTITVLPSPKPSFSADVYQECAPACIPFRDFSTISSGSISEWSWYFGNGDTSDVKNPVYCYPKSGVYSVTLTVTSNDGCSATLNKSNMITVFNNPVANFVATPQPTNILSPTIQFTDKSTDSYGIIYWWWNFGDNIDSVSSMENPTHTYSDTGTFCAKLGVMNEHGCVDTIIDCIVIDPIFTLYIPSAFSPNGDGVNDVFIAVGNDVKSFEMYIFDRWGMQLFHSTDINNGWDGRAKAGGSICQEDTYVYMIKATDNKNIQHSYTGSVNLIK
ncbi:MAG TPA: PKD domain-containing protein [Bacteroidia bacterium]|nr:PKD domain-containing protein [Bacteroidia bacterium]